MAGAARPQGHVVDDVGHQPRRTVTTWTADTGATNDPLTESTREPPGERNVVIVTFDSGQILDVTGPLEVFSSASRFLPAVRYRTQVVTTRGGSVRANCGLEFASSAIADVIGPVDTLIVAGGSGMDQAVDDSGCWTRFDVWLPTRAGSPRSVPAPSCSRPPACSRAGGRPPTGPIAVSWRPTTPRSPWIPTPSSSRTATCGPPPA